MTPPSAAPLFGGIEAGGTKFLCAVGTGPEQILAERRIPTTTPDETIARALDFFAEMAPGRELAALGIASFGPVELDPRHPLWGHILDTPKPGWSRFDLAGAFRRALGLPVAFQTDVNGAALGELGYGAGRGLADLAYVTIGTGIGAALISGGRLVNGIRHPEIGHIRPRRDRRDLHFEGCCPFHGDCFEGLASGTAILRRCGVPLHELPADHPMWSIEANYLAQLCATLVLAAAPARIILGGGVMQATALLPLLGPRLVLELGGYVPDVEAAIDRGNLLVPPFLTGRSGLVGALHLAATDAGHR